MASSVKVNVPGAVSVQISGIDGVAGLVPLGYTSDGVEITHREFAIEVKSDRYGGEQGPKIDKQYLGLEAEIRMTLTEFNAEYLNRLMSRLPGNAAVTTLPGVIVTPGTLAWSNGGLIRCLLYGVLDTAAVAALTPMVELLTPRNYPFCEVVDVVGFNLGTRHAKANLTLKANQGTVGSDVVLWNRVIV